MDLPRLKLMMEVFTTILPEASDEGARQIGGILGSEWKKILYALTVDIMTYYTAGARRGQWQDIDEYLTFLTQAIDYIRHKTQLMPDLPEAFEKEFENRLIMIQYQFRKRGIPEIVE